MTDKFNPGSRADLKAIQDAILLALGPVAEQYGVKITQHGGTLDSVAAILKFQVAPDVPGKTTAQIKAEADWARFANSYDMHPLWLGKTFQRANGESATIIGLQASRSKFPVLVRFADGKDRLLTTAEVVTRMAKQAVAA